MRFRIEIEIDDYEQALCGKNCPFLIPMGGNQRCRMWDDLINYGVRSYACQELVGGGFPGSPLPLRKDLLS